MFFIETSCFIQRVVEFIISDTGVTGIIQMADEGVDKCEKFIFKRIIVAFIKPINFIAPIRLILNYRRSVACPCT